MGSQPEPSEDIPETLVEEFETESAMRLRAISVFASEGERQSDVPQYVRHEFAVQNETVKEAIGEYAGELAEYLEAESHETLAEAHESASGSQESIQGDTTNTDDEQIEEVEDENKEKTTESNELASESPNGPTDSVVYTPGRWPKYDGSDSFFSNSLGDGNQHWKVSLFSILIFSLMVAGMTVITVTDQTGLNKQYINDTFEEEGVQQEMVVALEENLAEQLENETSNPERLASEAINKEFATTGLQRNINATVAYLRGDRDTLNLAMKYEPVRLSLLSMTDQKTHDTINESVPPEVDINIDPEDSGLSAARTFTTKLSTTLIVFAFLALIAVGVILYRTPSYRDAARHLALGLVVSSVITFLLGSIILIIGRKVTISTSGEVKIDPEILFDGILAVAEGMGTTMLIYSAVIFCFGAGLFAFSHSNKANDTFPETSRIRARNRPDTNSENEIDQTSASE
jgi:hypothetical protein